MTYKGSFPPNCPTHIYRYQEFCVYQALRQALGEVPSIQKYKCLPFVEPAMFLNDKELPLQWYLNAELEALLNNPPERAALISYRCSPTQDHMIWVPELKEWIEYNPQLTYCTAALLT